MNAGYWIFYAVMPAVRGWPR